MVYHSEQSAPDYFPPILSNGDLTFPVDCEGSIHCLANAFAGVEGFESVIYRAGRRLDFGHDRVPGILVSFGRLWFEIGSSVVSFTQELLEQKGLVKSVCTYEDGVRIQTEAFIHPDYPLYCVRKTVLSAPDGVKGEWRYGLCGYCKATEEAILNTTQTISQTGGTIGFQIVGQDMYRGLVNIRLDRTTEGYWDQRNLRLPFALKEKETLTLFLYLADNIDCAEPCEQCGIISEHIANREFEGLLTENISAWSSYFDRCYVKTSDETLNNIYRTALYHLRCDTTRWSIAVGITNLHWCGRYFAFDEYYGFLGLLGANQLELAKRVPSFRLNVCLDKAIRRQSKLKEEQARFPWISNEYGEETAIPGFWMDHVFHMSLIALGAFEYFEYSQDKEFLSRCYRMIRACAKFFTQHMIYQNENGVFLGKCSDLERLGASVENPFMSSCGAIRTLEVVAEAARILDVDAQYREQCLVLAEKLRAALPKENGMYVPYKNCPQKSVGVFAGKFPFNVLQNDDPFMHSAWNDFVENGGAYGNMYKTGTQLSPWYACWQAEGFARAKMGNQAYAFLQKAYPSTGVFHEMFEINEPARRLRPWFMTAAGIFVSAVNDMLVDSDGETVHLMPACPISDVAFKLAVKGGAVLEVKVCDGELVYARLESSEPKVMKLVYRDTVTLLKS